MRKSYVTIEDMGTERQNAGYAPSHPTEFPISSTSGVRARSNKSSSKRTSIADIESFASISDLDRYEFAREAELPGGCAREAELPGGCAREAEHQVETVPRQAQYAQRPSVKRSAPFAQSVTCPDIAGHVSNCPVCSRIYMQDPLVYYMIIAVLVIVIAMLLLRQYKD